MAKKNLINHVVRVVRGEVGENGQDMIEVIWDRINHNTLVIVNNKVQKGAMGKKAAQALFERYGLLKVKEDTNDKD